MRKYYRRKYHLSQKKCEWCNGEIEVNSNSQKFCDEEECRDDRYFQRKFEKLGLEKYMKFRIKQG